MGRFITETIPNKASKTHGLEKQKVSKQKHQRTRTGALGGRSRRDWENT